ncbi:MAG TPA: DUF5818 domain-containing protein [Terriglobales bacterium]
MKKLIAVFGMAAGLSVSAMAAEYTGYIVDEACASKKAMWGNEKCAQSCIGKGQQAVLVNEEGKVYKIADQDKVKEHAGHKVTISGTMNGDTIKVDSVKM